MHEGIEIWKAILIFFGWAVLDVLGSYCLLELYRLNKWSTTILTFCLTIGSGAGIYQYTHNFGYLFFAAAGSSLGNYILIVVEKKRQENSKKG